MQPRKRRSKNGRSCRKESRLTFFYRNINQWLILMVNKVCFPTTGRTIHPDSDPLRDKRLQAEGVPCRGDHAVVLRHHLRLQWGGEGERAVLPYKDLVPLRESIEEFPRNLLFKSGLFSGIYVNRWLRPARTSWGPKASPYDPSWRKQWV